MRAAKNEKKETCSVIEGLSLLILLHYVDKIGAKRDEKGLSRKATGYQHEPQVTKDEYCPRD